MVSAPLSWDSYTESTAEWTLLAGLSSFFGVRWVKILRANDQPRELAPSRYFYSWNVLLLLLVGWLVFGMKLFFFPFQKSEVCKYSQLCWVLVLLRIG